MMEENNIVQLRPNAKHSDKKPEAHKQVNVCKLESSLRMIETQIANINNFEGEGWEAATELMQHGINEARKAIT